MLCLYLFIQTFASRWHCTQFANLVYDGLLAVVVVVVVVVLVIVKTDQTVLIE